MKQLAAAILFVTTGLLSTGVGALSIGMIDTFQSGTTENWFAGGGPAGAFPPVPPHVVSSGGPTGANDAYLAVTSSGGAGPGGRLVVMNGTQWAGNYLATGVPTIEMDLINLGATDLAIRLLLENPTGGPPTDEVISASAFLLPAGGVWVHAVFPVSASDFVAILGDVTEALSTATLFRIIHSPTAQFPGDPIAGLLGIDNISAGPAPRPGPFPAPEPSALLLAVVAAIVACACARAQGRARRKS